MTFADKFKEIRKDKNLTQEELAMHLNIARSTIAGYETKRKEPDYETLRKIADFFEVSIDYLLGRTDEKSLYLIEGAELPVELRNVGINYITVAKKIKDEGFSPDEIEEILELAKKLRKE